MDDAAFEKAAFLGKVAKGETKCSVLSPQEATEFLATMLGGFNTPHLVDLLDDANLAPIAAKGLCDMCLVFDHFHDVAEKAKNGNDNAKAVIQSIYCLDYVQL